MGTPKERKKKTLAKLGVVCAKIEDLLAGGKITLAGVELPHEKVPGESKLDRLQRFRALLSGVLKEINSGRERAPEF